MSFPKYYVTYCVMDADAGANPFGHASLIFSCQEKDNSPVKVVDCIGYYGQPSTTSNPVVKGVKKIINLDADLQDGHGILKKEALRYIDGKGLRGISFEATQQQFSDLTAQYTKIMQTEEAAIEELNIELEAQGKRANGYTRYIAEKEKAAAEKRPPRLKPFHLDMKLTVEGLDSSNSYTCKSRSLELLTNNQVIPETIRAQLVCTRATTAFPRFSSLPLPPLRLVSAGEFVKSVSKSKGLVYFNHEWGTSSLYWASPVYTTETNLFNEEQDLNTFNEINDVLERIRETEISLLRSIDAMETETPDSEQLKVFRIQLQRVKNLSYLFSNAHENQIPGLLNNRLLKAGEVLAAAHWAMNPYRDSVHYSFLLRAYESVSLRAALIGVIAIALSLASILVAPISLGLGLAAVSTLFTARQIYGFYKTESQLTQQHKDYDDLLSLESELVASV